MRSAEVLPITVDAAATTAEPERAPDTKPGLRAWLSRIGPLLGLLLVLLAFSLLTGAPTRYLSPFNLRIVLTQTVVVGLGAIGMTMIIVAGGIDLSVGAIIALTSVVSAL